MPKHFNMSFKDLLAAKHPSTWIRFEKGEITETHVADNFFKDRREVDLDALKAMMVLLAP
jgi:FMN hydrolase / 5-amino-6-(5-phospho-D-ribitylamino)uracil phosphatase